MQHHRIGDGQTFVRLDTGDEVIASLQKAAAEAGVVSGWVMGIGSVSDVTLGYLDPDTGKYVQRDFDETMEVASLTGSITQGPGEDDKPFVHVHAVLAPRELLGYAGHLHEATVGAVMEIAILHFASPIEREEVAGKPFPWPFLPGEPRPEDEEGGDTAS